MDYTSGPYYVTIPAGVTHAAFDIPITNDSVFEYNENFMLAINSPALPTDILVGTTDQATVTIVNDDSKLW